MKQGVISIQNGNLED